MDPSGGFLRHTAPILHDLVPAIGILALNFEQQILDDLLFPVCRFRLRPVAAFFQFVAFMNEQGCVAAIVDHELWAFAFGMRNRSEGGTAGSLKAIGFPRRPQQGAVGRWPRRNDLALKNVAACPANAGS